MLGSVGQTVERKLRQELHPQLLEVIDESHQHHGHSGAHPSGESHFRVRISSHALAGKGRVQQHRMINQILVEELKSRIHALAIEVIAP